MQKIINSNILPNNTILNGEDIYRIEKELGQGGFGVVYKAKNLTDGSYVAIKEYFPSLLGISRDSDTAYITAGSHEELKYFKVGLEKFKNEALALAKFEHPNIVKIIDYVAQYGTEFFVMPFEDGITLKEYMKTFGKFPQEEIINLLVPLLNGLKEMHKHNFYHRDIKPENIFLRKVGMPMLIDFGAARQAIGEKSQDFTQMLTHGYAPPEQYETSAKRQGPWTDFYALAATIYTIITGEKPPSASDRTGAMSSCEIDPLKYPYTPEKHDDKLLNSLMKCMTLKVKDRFQNTDEWFNELFEDLDKEKTKKIYTIKEVELVSKAFEFYLHKHDGLLMENYVALSERLSTLLVRIEHQNLLNSNETKIIGDILSNYIMYLVLGSEWESDFFRDSDMLINKKNSTLLIEFLEKIALYDLANEIMEKIKGK